MTHLVVNSKLKSIISFRKHLHEIFSNSYIRCYHDSVEQMKENTTFSLLVSSFCFHCYRIFKIRYMYAANRSQFSKTFTNQKRKYRIWKMREKSELARSTFTHARSAQSRKYHLPPFGADWTFAFFDKKRYFSVRSISLWIRRKEGDKIKWKFAAL